MSIKSIRCTVRPTYIGSMTRDEIEFGLEIEMIGRPPFAIIEVVPKQIFVSDYDFYFDDLKRKLKDYMKENHIL